MNVLSFAQEIDRSAQRFYEEMATRAQQPGVARIFRMLAEDEGKLLSRHRALREVTDGCEAETLDERVNVFEALRERETELAVESDIAAYRLALEAEQELLRQYRKAAKAEKHVEAKRLLSTIVQDEMEHVAELESLYDFTNAPNHYLAWGEFSNLDEFRNYGRNLV